MPNSSSRPGTRADLLRNLSPRARTRLGWALAPALASLAVLLQWIIDVPKGEMLEREPPTLVGDLDDSSDDNDLSPTKPKGERTRPRKPKPQKPKPVARSAEQLKQLRDKWSSLPLEDEPTDQRFRRQYEALLRSVATRARTDALGEREAVPMQIRPTCRTLRCALELCGDKALIDDVAELLPLANVRGTSLWHELREIDPTRQPAKVETDKSLCRRWIVDFGVENAAVGEVRFKEPPPPTEPT